MGRLNRNYLFIFSLLFIILITFSSCTTTKKHTQVEYVHDTVVHTQYVDKVKYDSIYLHDSIYTYVKGDTVFYTKYKDMYKYIYLRDTIHSTDTLRVVDKKEEVKVVENTATMMKNRITGALLGILLCALIIGVWYANKKIIKKL